MSVNKTGTLYVVATPIGNLADMTPRAIDTLKMVDLIAAEDTRHAKKLLQHFDIDTPTQAYHDHNEQAQCDRLTQRLCAGDNIALISDAGTPLISDPGFRLTQAVHQFNHVNDKQDDAAVNHIDIVPIVGACAGIAALSVAGLPSDRFSFEGFLPNKSSQRRIKLNELQHNTATMIFYESPHRIVACLQDMMECFGHERLACLCRELTKTFETVKKSSLAELLHFVQNDANQQKGEIVLVVSGSNHQKQADIVDDKTKTLLSRLLEDLPVKKACLLVSELTGIKKNKLYDLALTLRQ